MGANRKLFEAVWMLSFSHNNLATGHLHALGSLLGKNILPNLQSLYLTSTRIASDALAALLRGLEQGAYADKLQRLHLDSCSICVEGAKVLGLAIGRDVLPSLQYLSISYNRGLGDEGVTSLALGLQTSSRTKLISLSMRLVGMGDAGLESLAEAISSGALEDCSFFDAAYSSSSLCNVFPFVTAVRSGGPRKLTFLSLTQGHEGALVPASVAILVYSLLKHCPKLRSIDVPKVGPGATELIEDMCNTFGRRVVVTAGQIFIWR